MKIKTVEEMIETLVKYDGWLRVEYLGGKAKEYFYAEKRWFVQYTITSVLDAPYEVFGDTLTEVLSELLRRMEDVRKDVVETY